MEQHTIDQDFHDVRLDKFIKKHYPEFHLASVYKLIRKGRIKVNGKKKKQNYRLQQDDLVTVWVAVKAEKSQEADSFVYLSKEEKREIQQGIVFEDESLLFFNKQQGFVMYRGSGHQYGLAEMLKSYCGNQDFTFVNRIDKATSGLIIGAKNLPTVRTLSELIRKREVKKYYTVVVEGLVRQDTFTLSSYLKKEEIRVVQSHSKKEGFQQAVSSFKVIKRGAKRTLLEAFLETGRTHQLRVQLAEINHPIVGDQKYGRGEGSTMLLFSRRVVIPSYDIDLQLDLPAKFLAALEG